MIPLLLRTSGRTGSTLLLNLLKSSPQILVRGEYPFEERLLSYFYRLSELPFFGQQPISDSQWTHESLLDPCKLMGSYPGSVPIFSDPKKGQSHFIKILWSAYLGLVKEVDAHEYSYLAEKTYDSIASLNENIYCKNIFLVRDPRDQLISIREFDKKRGYKGFGQASSGGLDSIRHLCESLKGMYELASGINEGEDRRILLRYEDLISDRANSLARLGKWLSVSFDLDAFERENIQYRSLHSTTQNQDDSIARWKDQLDGREIAIFRGILGPYMFKLGYL